MYDSFTTTHAIHQGRYRQPCAIIVHSYSLASFAVKCSCNCICLSTVEGVVSTLGCNACSKLPAEAYCHIHDCIVCHPVSTGIELSKSFQHSHHDLTKSRKRIYTIPCVMAWHGMAEVLLNSRFGPEVRSIPRVRRCTHKTHCCNGASPLRSSCSFASRAANSTATA